MEIHGDPELELDDSALGRELVGRLPFFVFIVGQDGGVEQCNDWFANYTGLPPVEAEARPWRSLIHPEDWATESPKWQDDWEKGQSFEAELRLLRHDKVYRWHLVRMVPMQEEESQLWVGSALDIHDRRFWELEREGLLRELGAVMERRWTAEENLRQSEERFRAAFEQAAVGILIARVDGGPENPGGGIQLANPGFRAMLGYGNEEMTHLTLRDLTFPDDQDVDKVLFSGLLAGKVPFYSVEKRLLPKAGRPLWCQISTSPMRGPSGSVLATLSFVTDISERRHSEEARQRAENEAEENRQLFGRMASAMPGMLYLLDLKEERSLYAAGASNILLGYEPEQLLGFNHLLLDLVHEEDRETLVDHLRSCVSLGDGEPAECEFRLRHADGTYRWLHSRQVVFSRDRRGKSRTLLGVAVDVTQRRDAEDALRRSHEELEQRVAERTAELQAINERLEGEIARRRDAQVARGQLLRRLVSVQEDERKSISRELHDEFGQSLTALMLGLKSLTTDEQNEVKINQLQKLTQQVMEQMHHLARELRPAALDTLGLEAAMRQGVQDWTERNEVRTEFFARGLQAVRVPPPVETTLYRVSQEALTNVAKHAQATFVSVLLERHDGVVSLIVEDNGSGFDAEAPGHGEGRLGLLGMHERLELVGGTLDIESSQQGGTTLVARVPLEGNPAIGRT